MTLTRFIPDCRGHQRFILELVNTDGWKAGIAQMSVATPADAATYLRTRAKMFTDNGVGSFAIVVPKNRMSSSPTSPTSPYPTSEPDGGGGARYDNGDSNSLDGQQHVIVGLAGLILRPEFRGDYDLGFALLPAYEGRGFAFEASALLMHWARRGLNLHRMRAGSRVSNVRSRKLLGERLGFRHHEEGDEDDAMAQHMTRVWGAPQYVWTKTFE